MSTTLRSLIHLLGLVPSLAYDNGVARTPPMGWNSWNHFHCSVSAQIMRDTADRLIALGLAQAGYEYVNTDDCWLDRARSEDGRLVPGERYFPGLDEGMKSLSAYIHGKGLKFGIYGAAGQTTCASRAGGLYHEVIDAQSYAEWAVDYLKYDDCGEVNIQSYAKFQAMRDALNATGRPMVYSYEPHMHGHAIGWAPYIGNAWRTGDDIGAQYSSMFGDLTVNNAWANVGGPGAWNDADMLEVGNSGLSVPEARSHFALWCLIKSPLLIGCDLTKIQDEYLEILKNAELIAINQDSLGHQGRLVHSESGPSGYRLPEASPEARAKMPPVVPEAQFQAYSEALREAFGGVTDCQWPSAEAVGETQVWSLVNDSVRQGDLCVMLLDDKSVSLAPCDGSPAQHWEGLNETKVTVAQIYQRRLTPAPAPAPFFGAALGVPKGDFRRCGTCCGAGDTTSAMCRGSTDDGKLFVTEEEIRARCIADKTCVAFALNKVDGGYYRAVTNVDSIDSSDSKWTTWTTMYWDGPLHGSLQPLNSNHRCGTCCGANDTTSPMCQNATDDGRFPLLEEKEVRKRCENDVQCAGYGLETDWDKVEPEYFLAVSNVQKINWDDTKWVSWRKMSVPPSPSPASDKWCLATEGTTLISEPCLEEPEICSTTRCANSVRVRQLWYSTHEGQLVSSFTEAVIPPLPLASATSAADALRQHARASGLINVPKCLASAPNADPPRPPAPPIDADPQAPLQVWAGRLSGGRVAVVLSNADAAPASITAKWQDIWLPAGTAVKVRDAIGHEDRGSAVGEISAEVPSHDVAVFVLTPEATSISV